MHRIIEKLKAEFDDLLETDRCTHSMEYRWLDLKKSRSGFIAKGIWSVTIT